VQQDVETEVIEFGLYSDKFCRNFKLRLEMYSARSNSSHL